MPNDLFIAKLTAFKERLLDLTGRNRMIHSNFQAKTRLHFRFIDELPNQLYEKLSTSQMHFQALPNPDEAPKDENNSTFKRELEVAMLSDEEYLKEINDIEAKESDDLNQQAEEALRKLKNRVRKKLNLVQLEEERFSIVHHAELHGLNPSYDLPKSKETEGNSSHHQDNKIQTLMLADNLKRHITSIYGQYKSSIRELGVNPLYVCFGFLEWTESATSEKKLYSPILMLQVEMDDEKPSSNLGITSTGDSISINQTLNERLKRDFKFELPELELQSEDEEEDKEFSIEDYLELVEEKIAKPNNWKVRNWASFGVYKAQNMPIYQDIEKLISDNTSELLEKLISGTDKDAGDSGSREIYDADDETYVTDVPALVTAADASQFSAVVDVVQGKNLVIKGPPGTGKSQTITNIIAALMLKGKKVLFVAQKQAALDVVRNNLAAVGLEKFLLEVFSIKGKKKAIMESFAERVNESEPPDATNYFQKLTALQKTKKELNTHAKILSEEFEDSGISIHDIIWDVPVIEGLPDNQLRVFELDEIKKINEETLNKNINDLVFVKDVFQKVFGSTHATDHSITCVNANISNPFERNKVIESLDKFSADTHQLVKTLNQTLDKDTGFKKASLQTIVDSEIISSFSNDDLNDDELSLLTALLDNKNAETVFKLLESELERQKLQLRLDEDQRFVDDNFDVENSLYDANDIKQAILKLKDSHFFSFFFSDWRAARRLFKEIYIGEGSFKGKEEAELLQRYQVFDANFEKNTDEIKSLELEVKAIEEDLASDLPDEDVKKLKSHDIDYCFNLIEQLKKLPEEFRLAWFKDKDSLKVIFKNGSDLIAHADVVSALTNELAIKASDDVLQLATLLNEIQTSDIPLQDYMELLAAEGSLSADESLHTFYKKFIELALDIENLGDAYKRIIRLMQQELVYQMHPDYSKYNSKYVEKLINDLERYDKEISKLSSKLVASESMSTLGRYAPQGSKTGKRSTWTDMSLINHVAATPAARTTVRELFQRAIDAATSIKPCTLMSPLAVSQTLKLDEIYDVVIIDEASQMKPEFSIGAIARAKQAVIVGDPNQLPPTSVFQTKNAEDPNDEDLGDESILDMGLAVLFPPRELLYHYRSRHEDLIRFSNAEFYKNLMIPVTARRNETNKGIKHIFLEEARYVPGSDGSAGGINPLEADRVVNEVLRLMKERPHESIGVATMNQKQKELIENKFILEKSKSKDALKYEAYWAEKDAGLNEFFIKNLENVQGDERDVIVISTLYGPHEKDGTRGSMHQRFGDINKDAGWRRLNVLFTRAKNQILLITSMTPADIKEDGRKRGVEVLKKYIGFAETKILQEAKSTDREIESPFQHWAINQVNALPGFSAEWEIGASGYRIDIGVKHEDYPYGFVMAVETDGATYHSTKSARDRDLLRQKILEGYGWKFHRIWSSDWIANPVATKEKLHSAMKARLEECLKEVEARKAEAAQRETEADDEIIFDDIPEDNDGVQAFAYPITDIADYLDVQPDKFSNQSYKALLATAVNAVIELEGPIAFPLLVERIRKAHGFARAGAEIRSTVAATIKLGTKKTIYNDIAFYWADNLDPENYLEARFPSGEARDIADVAPEEIKSIEKYLKQKEGHILDVAKAISEFLGHRVLKEPSRTEIEDKLQS